eukprot:15326110-Ditylum_brightwellii.AAC.1
MQYLKEKKIFLNPNCFETAEAASPGFFIAVHPEIARKDLMKSKLRNALAATNASDKLQVMNWINKYHPNLNLEEEFNPIPNFLLLTTKRKFGNGLAKDAAYLKALLSQQYKNTTLRYGFFVPSGTHLVTSATEFKELLRRQNTFTKKMKVMPIEGISQDTIYDQMVIDGTMQDLKTYLTWENNPYGINRVEGTNKTDELGK